MAVTINGSTGVDYADNIKQKYGTGGDLEIYHDGSNSYIKDAGTGSLFITTDGSAVQFQKGDTEVLANFGIDGSCGLYYDNTKRFETTSGGSKVTGNLVVVGDDVRDDNHKSKWGTGDDLQIYHDGSNSYLYQNGTGELRANAATFRVMDRNGGETQILASENGAVELYHNNCKTFETTSNGIKVFDGDNSSTIIMGDTDHGARNIHCNSNLIGFLTQAGGWGSYTNDDGDHQAKSYTAWSDQNLKKDITATDLGLSFINKLNPVSFKWKESLTDKTHYGLVAQEVETIIKGEGKDETKIGFISNELVIETGKDAEKYYGLNYDELISPLIKAVQELSAEVETLKTKVAALEAHTHE